MTPVGEILVSLMDGVRLGASLPELLCLDACRRLPVSAAGIALMDSASLIAGSAGSDGPTLALQDLQMTLGEGPCVEAFATGRLVLVPDLAREGPARWPAYTPAAVGAGAGAAFCYPLRIGNIRLGVLDLYREAPGMLDDRDLDLALHYVDAAILILLHVQSLDVEATVRREAGRDLDTPIEAGLEVAFRSHAEVHQATGMIAVQADLGLKEALLLLRAHAFAIDRPIRHVAVDVVDRRLSFN